MTDDLLANIMATYMALNVQDISSNRLAKTMSATEVKNNLGSVINWTLQHRDQIVIESRGTPKAVIMPYGTYQEILEILEENQRRQALAEWEQLSEAVQRKNPGMTEGDVEAIAQDIRDDVLNNVVANNNKKYG